MNDRDMIDERELLELFARRRPDRERIANGIAQRLADDEAGTPPRHTSHGPLSKAAAWLPLPLQFKGSGPWLWLSLPILLLAGTWMALFGAGSNIRKSVQAGPQPRQASNPARKRAALQRPGFVAGAFLIGGATLLPMLGWHHLFDTLLVASVLSMFSLAHLVKKNVALGHGDRDQMAAICVGLLDTLLVFTLVYCLFGFRGADTGQWAVASPLVLAVGTLAFARYVPAQCFVSLAAAGYLLFLSQFSLFQPTSAKPATLEQLHAFVQAPQPEAHGLRLRNYRSTVLAMRAAKQDVVVPADLWEQTVKPIGPNLPIDSFSLAECARMNLLPASEWQRIAATSYRTRQVDAFLAETGPLKLESYDEYLFHLVMTRELSEQQIATLAKRLMASWPAATDDEPLARCRLVTAGLDQIGRSDLAEQQRELVHAAIVRCQQTVGFDAGGFREPSKGHKPSSGDIAMALMARFAVPAELDVHALRAHLTRKMFVPDSKHAELRNAAYASYAHLLQLDEQVGPLPDRSVLRVITDERMLWSMIAMVLLCIYTVRITPARAPSTERERTGAMP